MDGKLFKVQCKHCVPHLNADGQVDCVRFKTVWQSHNSASWVSNKYQEDEVDYFATFFNGECYLIPIKECGAMKTLRVLPSKNNQYVNTSSLMNYSAEYVLAKLRQQN